ncbi:MAG: hypothetical protein WAL59_14705, partial [Roseiarcus sp.]
KKRITLYQSTKLDSLSARQLRLSLRLLVLLVLSLLFNQFARRLQRIAPQRLSLSLRRPNNRCGSTHLSSFAGSVDATVVALYPMKSPHTAVPQRPNGRLSGQGFGKGSPPAGILVTSLHSSGSIHCGGGAKSEITSLAQ